MRRATTFAVAAAFALGGLAGAAALLAEKPAEKSRADASRPAWTEVAWPFLEGTLRL
jgi:hypothetical protein